MKTEVKEKEKHQEEVEVVQILEEKVGLSLEEVEVGLTLEEVAELSLVAEEVAEVEGILPPGLLKVEAVWREVLPCLSSLSSSPWKGVGLFCEVYPWWRASTSWRSCSPRSRPPHAVSWGAGLDLQQMAKTVVATRLQAS